MPNSFSPGDNVHVSAIVASIDMKKKTAKVSVGWGPQRSIMVVPLALLSKPLPSALVEAATWASELYSEGNKQ